jgi:hypothetical protein
MRGFLSVAALVAAALLLVACGGGSSSSPGSGSASTTATTGNAKAGGGSEAASGPEKVWAKEVEGVMRDFENSSAHSVESIHTSSSQYLLEPVYARYSDELAKLGKQLEATDPPATCKQVYARMGVLARKVSDVMGVLGAQGELSPEEFFALANQQGYKFSRVGRQLTKLTIHPHC